ncbi:hypothetical protein, partial [Bacillus thuringiensis]|uniref:hypothetical protein n=1 Tax=Bacillus thuringiensis TaxID=1428 RepID=UPI0028525820
ASFFACALQFFNLNGLPYSSIDPYHNSLHVTAQTIYEIHHLFFTDYYYYLESHIRIILYPVAHDH